MNTKRADGGKALQEPWLTRNAQTLKEQNISNALEEQWTQTVTARTRQSRRHKARTMDGK